MKIRRTIALLTAFMMVAAMVPAMALSAFAEDAQPEGERGLVTADGMHAYKIVGDNLIADGSFEGDDWGDQLTVGADHGNDGLEYTSSMADSGVWRRARLAADAYDGQYALRLDSTTSASGNVINDANKPASIKHYVYNDTNKAKKYYVGFYGMGPSSISFSLSSVDEYEESVAGTDAMLNQNGWTPVEGVIDVPRGKYLLINIYNMSAGTYIDNFVIYEITTDGDTQVFDNAMRAWRFNHEDGERVTADIKGIADRPGGDRSAKVEWSSSNPSIISATGDYNAPAEDTVVTLTAKISYGIFSTTRTYRFVAVGIGSDVRSKLIASVPYVVEGNLRLINTLEGYSGSRVTWSSSDTSIIDNNGRYKAPSEQGTLTLTATFTWEGAVIECPVEVIVGTHFSLISNGGFDVVRDLGNGTSEIYGWTTGVSGANGRTGVAQMTTETFDIAHETLTDANGRPYDNTYLVSKLHAGLDNAGSIRRYVKLTADKFYRLSFKARYMGTGTSDELYMGAYLVPSSGEELMIEPTANFATQYGTTYGGIYYKDYNEWHADAEGRLTADDGWRTYETILRPTALRSYLLIAGKWLNKTDNGQSDGRWGFDDFTLEEVNIPFYSDVTVNYLDYATGAVLKRARVETQQPGTMQYTVPESDKADITYLGETYRYDPTSTDSIVVAESDNVINLYFRRLVPVDINVNFVLVDGDGQELGAVKPAEKFSGYSGLENVAPDSVVGGKRGVLFIGEKTYRYVGGNDPFIASEDPDENVMNLRYVEVDNIIKNGGFNNGLTGWENRKGTAPTGTTIEFDSSLGSNVLSFGGGTGGKGDTNNLGTQWAVTSGKRYCLEFDLYGTVLTTNNYTYNKISDKVGTIDTDTRDAQGNILYEYGSAYSGSIGSWSHMSVIFTASTDVVYMQSSYFEGVKFANFMLYEYTSDFTADVTVNYLDRETGRQLKAPRVQPNVDGMNDGSLTYTATSADKNSITVDGQTYRYDTTSNDTVVVKPSGNVIDLYFVIYGPVSVDDIVIELNAEQELVLPTKVPVLYTDGTTPDTNVTWEEIPTIEPGDVVTIKGVTVAGLELNAVVKRFYIGDASLPGDYDQYDWVGLGEKFYAVEKGSRNLVTNGGFTDGCTGFTRASDGGQLNWTVVDNDKFNSGKAAHFEDKATGGGGEKTLRTFYNVKAGKSYYVAYHADNTSSSATSAQGTTGMSAFVATEGPASGKGWGDAKNSGVQIYSHIDNGGFNSWSSNGTANTDFPVIGTPKDRDDGVLQPGLNLLESIVNVPATATDPHIMLALGANGSNFVQYGDITLYEIVSKDKYYEGGAIGMSSKVTINLNGENVDEIYVNKGEAAPDLSSEYVDCVIDSSHIDTNEPNGGTIYVTDPAKLSSIIVGRTSVQVQARGESLNGVLIVAKYNTAGQLIDVETADISVADGEYQKVSIDLAAGTKLVRAMVVESVESLRPLLRSAAREF